MQVAMRYLLKEVMLMQVFGIYLDLFTFVRLLVTTTL